MRLINQFVILGLLYPFLLLAAEGNKIIQDEFNKFVDNTNIESEGTGKFKLRRSQPTPLENKEAKECIKTDLKLNYVSGFENNDLKFTSSDQRSMLTGDFKDDFLDILMVYYNDDSLWFLTDENNNKIGDFRLKKMKIGHHKFKNVISVDMNLKPDFRGKGLEEKLLSMTKDFFEKNRFKQDCLFFNYFNKDKLMSEAVKNSGFSILNPKETNLLLRIRDHFLKKDPEMFQKLLKASSMSKEEYEMKEAIVDLRSPEIIEVEKSRGQWNITKLTIAGFVSLGVAVAMYYSLKNKNTKSKVKAKKKV